MIYKVTTRTVYYIEAGDRKEAIQKAAYMGPDVVPPTTRIVSVEEVEEPEQ